MATIYTYSDTYIVNSLEDAEIEASETKALVDLGKQGVTAPSYLEEMCKCLVYIDLCGKQLEAEGMIDRVAYYRKEYNRYNTMNLHGDTDEKIYSVEIGRG